MQTDGYAWISAAQKLVSFHPIDGGVLWSAPSQDVFWRKIMALVQKGFRLQ